MSLAAIYRPTISGTFFLVQRIFSNKCIDAISKRKKECEVRIGFLGGTGTGKSSLINALLMMQVLPRNEEVASTAVPVEVSYNNDNDPAQLFRAVIEGISETEFTREVQQLFEDFESWEATDADSEDDSEDDGEDHERHIEIYQRMNNTIEKIKWLYPDIQSVEDLDSTTAEELLDEPHVQKMLDSKKYVHATTESAFADNIKQYIESSKPKKGDKVVISLWPLVKVVRIYVKADILKSGIILVDLPGSHDTSAARVAVADNYRKNLTASIVCAPAVRAGSDRVAQELLSSVERRTMQLDGLYTSDSLFFVITKIDDLMDYEAYVRDHENLQQANEQDMQRIYSKAEQIEELRQELDTRKKKQSKAKKIVGKMREANGRLGSRVDKILEAIATSGNKRKRVDDLTGMLILHVIGCIFSKGLQHRMNLVSVLLKKSWSTSYEISETNCRCKLHWYERKEMSFIPSAKTCNAWKRTSSVRRVE